MKINVFSSGSAGNSTLIEIADKKILVDAGISKKMIEENLNKKGLSINDISMLFITHEHEDHIRSLQALIKYDNITIFLTKGTYDYIFNSYKVKNANLLKKLEERLTQGTIKILSKIGDNSIFYKSFEIDNLKIDVLPTFHDASESVGFIFHENDKKIVYITDTGYVHQSLYELISNADAYILESNHDPEILMHSNRPYNLKIRILSNHGHLSNEDSMVTLAHVMGNKTKLVMHAHISQECNLGQIVEMTRKKVLDEYAIDTEGIDFVVLNPYPSKEYEV
ncbi:MAG: MBL fold metallo-hydrolase [Anaeroplasma sp.]|nr:MBL fold metallo-hydrolase [Anaeroplasma sp.]